MASKTTLELQELSNEDLLAEMNDTERQYQKLKFDHAVRGLDNPVVLRRIRRNVARLKTEIRKREISEMSKEDLDNRSKIRKRRRRQKRS